MRKWTKYLEELRSFKGKWYYELIEVTLKVNSLSVVGLGRFIPNQLELFLILLAILGPEADGIKAILTRIRIE